MLKMPTRCNLRKGEQLKIMEEIGKWDISTKKVTFTESVTQPRM
jgi:hypothetical protein